MKTFNTTPFGYKAHMETAFRLAEKSVEDAKADGRNAFFRKWGQNWRVYIERRASPVPANKHAVKYVGAGEAPKALGA